MALQRESASYPHIFQVFLMRPTALSLLVAACTLISANADESTRLKARVRASEINPEAREYPQIGYVFGTEKSPQDYEVGSFDPAANSRGELVIWMMGHNDLLAERVNSYGYHFVQPHYARQWFSKVCRENPVGETCRGNMRLEAATGEDFSDSADIQKPDGMIARVTTLLKWLDKEQPKANWGQFLTDSNEIRWDKVVMAGSSHGSTTSARFAKHQKVARVVMFCGPRDQLQNWQSLPSATPANRYFGFSHVLDGGWVDDHYCRSWELLGLHEFGPIVNVDEAKLPYSNTRRLITDFDVNGDANRAHSSVTPGSRAKKNADGTFAHEDVWRYLFTHPVDDVGEPGPMDDSCDKNQRD